MQLAGYLLGCIKRFSVQHWWVTCTLGINSLSCICFSLILTYHTQGLSDLENREKCYARDKVKKMKMVPIKISHWPLFVYRWWNGVSLTVVMSYIVAFLSTFKRIGIAILCMLTLDWCKCNITGTQERQLSLAMGKISSHSGRVNHGNHIDSPITFSESDLHQPSRDSPLISSPSFRFSSLKKTLYPRVSHFKGG